jgi:hypothetical protein
MQVGIIFRRKLRNLMRKVRERGGKLRVRPLGND